MSISLGKGSNGAQKHTKKSSSKTIPLSAGMLLVTLGVVYGDIGTSPMYVMKSIVNGNGGLASVSEDMILGALSLVIWTITLITTIKYVVVAMKADNQGEGGIFSLYSLVRKKVKWIVIPAMIGGSALLADGVLTPAVTVTTAIEGLRTTEIGHAVVGMGQGRVVAITIVIIVLLFVVQQAGTSSIGRAFGPIMTAWFLFLGISGLVQMVGHVSILRAFNPVRGLVFLFSDLNAAGLKILGFVFLCTTGAEALYSDMGHVGKANIYVSWPFVKACLILNYLGQGAWVLNHQSDTSLLAITDLNPFFQMLPERMRPFAVLLSTIAAIIASQALITGSFTLVSEAARLDLMPHLQVTYPSETKGQIYIPLVNWIMLAGCIFVVLLFRSSERMEAAYGLAITVTMLMTTTLLVAYIARVKKKPLLSVVFALVFGAIELSFFFACLTMFFDGGYVMIILSALLFVVMFVWKRGTAIERSQSVYLETINYVDQLARLRDDESVPLLADNLVFLTNNSSNTHLDRDILYSILDKRPKRAKAYWFLTVQVAGGPHTLEYSVNDFDTDFVFKVHIKLGFKVNQRVNSFLRQIVGDLVESGELAPQGRPYSIYHNPGNVGNFRFCMLHKVLSPESDISGIDLRIMSLKYFIRSLCGSPAQWFGLENSSVLTETVPLFTRTAEMPRLKRVSPGAGVTGKIRRITEDDQAHSGDADDIISGNIASVRAKVTSDLATSVIGGDTAVFTPIRTHDDEDSCLDEEALAEELAVEEGIIAAEVSAKADDDLSDIGASS